MLISYITHLAAAANTCNPNKTFFGLPVWYKYLPYTTDPTGACNFTIFNGPHGFTQGLLLIGLAVVDILLRVAGLVAVGFIIYAGINFITSQGNPEDAASARGTAINALIGLILSMAAIILVQFIGSSLK